MFNSIVLDSSCKNIIERGAKIAINNGGSNERDKILRRVRNEIYYSLAFTKMVHGTNNVTRKARPCQDWNISVDTLTTGHTWTLVFFKET